MNSIPFHRDFKIDGVLSKAALVHMVYLRSIP